MLGATSPANLVGGIRVNTKDVYAAIKQAIATLEKRDTNKDYRTHPCMTTGTGDTGVGFLLVLGTDEFVLWLRKAIDTSFNKEPQARSGVQENVNLQKLEEGK